MLNVQHQKPFSTRLVLYQVRKLCCVKLNNLFMRLVLYQVRNLCCIKFINLCCIKFIYLRCIKLRSCVVSIQNVEGKRDAYTMTLFCIKIKTLCCIKVRDLCCIKSGTYVVLSSRFLCCIKVGLVLYQDHINCFVSIHEDILSDVWLFMFTRCYMSPLEISYPQSDLLQHMTI